jgi:FolB domain-containing protein
MDCEDVVFVRNISIQAVVGLDCWQREKPQKVLVSVRVSHSLLKAAEADDISYTLDYRKIYNDAILPLGLERHNSLLDLTRKAIQQIFSKCGKAACTITVTLPNALLNSDVGVSITKSVTPYGMVVDDSMSITDLRIYCIIGVNPAERLVRQPVIFSINARGLQGGAESTNFQRLFRPMIKARSMENGCVQNSIYRLGLTTI